MAEKNKKIKTTLPTIIDGNNPWTSFGSGASGDVEYVVSQFARERDNKDQAESGKYPLLEQAQSRSRLRSLVNESQSMRQAAQAARNGQSSTVSAADLESMQQQEQFPRLTAARQRYNRRQLGPMGLAQSATTMTDMLTGRRDLPAGVQRTLAQDDARAFGHTDLTLQQETGKRIEEAYRKAQEAGDEQSTVGFARMYLDHSARTEQTRKELSKLDPETLYTRYGQLLDTQQGVETLWSYLEPEQVDSLLTWMQQSVDTGKTVEDQQYNAEKAGLQRKLQKGEISAAEYRISMDALDQSRETKTPLYNDITKRAENVKTQKEIAAFQQEVEEYRADPSFDALKIYRVQEHNSPKWDSENNLYDTGYNDAIYAGVNGDEHAQYVQRMYDANIYQNAGKHVAWFQQPQEIVEIYNYLYAKKGKAAAENFMERVAGLDYGFLESMLAGGAKGIGLTSYLSVLESAAGIPSESQLSQTYYGPAMAANPTAATIGNIGGSLALMYGGGKLVGLAGKALGASGLLGNAAQSAGTFMLTDAVQNAGDVAAGRMTTEDYLKSIGVSGAGGLAGSLAQELVLSEVGKVIASHGQQHAFQEWLRQTAGGMAFSLTNTGTVAVLNGEQMSSEELLNTLVTSFLYSSISAAIKTSNATQAAKAELEADKETLGRLMQDVADSAKTPEERVAACEELRKITNNARDYVGSHYYAGQQEYVNETLSLLDTVDDFVDVVQSNLMRERMLSDGGSAVGAWGSAPTAPQLPSGNGTIYAGAPSAEQQSEIAEWTGVIDGALVQAAEQAEALQPGTETVQNEVPGLSLPMPEDAQTAAQQAISTPAVNDKVPGLSLPVPEDAQTAAQQAISTPAVNDKVPGLSLPGIEGAIDNGQLTADSEGTRGRIATSPSAPRNDTGSRTGSPSAVAVNENGGRAMLAPTAAKENGGQARLVPTSEMGGIENGAAVAERRADAGRTEGVTDGTERDAGLGAGREAGAVGSGAEGRLAGSAAASTDARKKAEIAALSAERQSARALGIRNGGRNQTLQVIADERLYTSDMVQAAEDAEASGAALTFVKGQIEVWNPQTKQYAAVDGVRQENADGSVSYFIRADLRARSAGQLYAHEAFHELAARNPALWRKMADYLTDNFDEAQIGRLLDAYSEAYDGIYGDDEASMMKYLEEAFADVYAKIRRGRADTRIVQETMGVFGDQIENARRNAQTTEAIRETRGSPGERYSVSRTQDMTIKEQLQAFRNGNMKSYDEFFFGETPSVYQGTELGNDPIVMSQKDFKKSKTNKHNVPNRVWSRIDQVIADPILSFDNDGYYSILTKEIDADGKPLLLGINQGEQTENLRINRMKSAYGLDNPHGWIENQIINKRNLRIYDKERAISFLKSIGHEAELTENYRSGERIPLADVFVNRVFDDGTGLGSQYSMSEKDEPERPGLPQRVSLPTLDSLRQAAPDTSLEEGGMDAESGDAVASNARRYGVERNDAGDGGRPMTAPTGSGAAENGGRIATSPEAPRNDAGERDSSVAALPQNDRGGRIATFGRNETGDRTGNLSATEYQQAAREKKEGLAEKASPETLKRRIQSAEQKLKAFDYAKKAGIWNDQMQQQLDAVQETLEIDRAALEQKSKAERRAKEKQREVDRRAAQPKIAKRDFRIDALNLFSIQAGSRAELGKVLDRFADDALRKGSVSHEDRRALLQALYERGIETIPADPYYGGIRQELRGGRVYVDDSVRTEFGDDWEAFRKRAWGTGIYLTNSSTDPGIDVWNQGLAENYPGSFDEETTDLKSVLESMIELAEEGKAEHVSLPEMMRRQEQEFGVSVDEQMDDLERKLDQLIDKFAEKAELEVSTRTQGMMQLIKERQAFREMIARESAKRHESQVRNEVMGQIKQLNRMRNRTAPEVRAQIDGILGNLDVVARSISPQGIEDLQALGQVYERAKDDPNFLPNPYVEARLARLQATQLDELEIGDAIELGRTIAALVKSVQDSNRMLADERHREISEAAAQAFEEVSQSKGSRGALQKWLANEHLSPTRMIQRLGGWLRGGEMERLSRSLEQGGIRQLEYMRDASKFFDEFTEKKEHRAWLKTASGKQAQWIKVSVPVGLRETETGAAVQMREIEITPMMRVSLLLHSMNADNLRHIETGGITIPDKGYYRKGDMKEALARGTRVKMRPETVRAIVRECTPQERAFAEVLHRYFNDFSTPRINEVSMQIDGFERAGGDHYFHIKTDPNFLAKQPETVQRNISLESIGSIVNERVHAGNPIVLEDASDALLEHIDTISKYYGYAVPLRDFNAVRNYTFHESGNAFDTSINEAVAQKWGSGAQNYLDRLTADLQQRGSANEAAAKWMNKLRGNLAGATLMLNPAVALSQAASLPGAMQTLGVDALLYGLQLWKRADMKLIEKFTPLLWYRNQGNSTQELGDYMSQQGLEKKLPWLLNWIQKMDSATIRRLWVASEYRVRHDTGMTPGDKAGIEAGTDPFYQAVAEVFGRAVMDTQPNYTVMQRPQILRSGSDLTKFLTMYKTVPLQYYNMMFEAVGRLRADAERAKVNPDSSTAQEHLKQSRSFFAKTMIGVLTANVVYVGMKALIKALTGRGKKYEDEEGNYFTGEMWKRLGLDLAETYAGSLIGGTDLMQLMESVVGSVTGNEVKFYGSEVSALSHLNDIGENVVNLFGAIGSMKQDEGMDAIRKTALNIASAFGIPAKNAETYLKGTLRLVLPECVMRYENVFDEVDKNRAKGIRPNANFGRDQAAAIRVLMDNRTEGLSDDSIGELQRLWNAGVYSALPTAVPSSVSVNGESVKLDLDQRGKYRSAWSKIASENLETVLQSDTWLTADDQTRGRMLSELYDYANDVAKAAAIDGYELDSHAEKYRALTEQGISLDVAIPAYVSYREIYNDKDAESPEKGLRLSEYFAGLELRDEHKLTLYQGLSGEDKRCEKLGALLENGVGFDLAFESLFKYSEIANDEGLSSVEKGIRERELISGLKLTDNQKLLMYRIFSDADSRCDKFQAIMDAGLSFKQTVQVFDAHEQINDKDLKANEQASEFAHWIDQQGLSSEQEDVIREQLKFWTMSPGQATRYDKFTDAGIDSDLAYQLDETIGALEPPEGKDQVQDIQKWRVVIDTVESPEEQIKALSTVMDESPYRCVRIAWDFGVSPDVYVSIKEILQQYDANHNGNYSQTEVNDAISAYYAGIGLTLGRDLNVEKAVLWQLLNASSKATNNPYSANIGNRVIAARDADRAKNAEDSEEADDEGLKLPDWMGGY